MKPELNQTLSFDIIVRLKTGDAHYGGNLISGARILELFGDAITGLSAVEDNDEGLLAGWEYVKFFKTVHPGDFLKIEAIITSKTRMRRYVEVIANRIIRGGDTENSSVEYMNLPEKVASAEGVIVIPVSVAKSRKIYHA